MITIRNYTLQDVDLTIEIYPKAIRGVFSKYYGPEKIEAWAQIDDRKHYANNRLSRPTWITNYNGEPAGWSDLEASGYLDMMFVHPQYQGLGIASRLLKTVEDTSRKQGQPVITTEASLTARPFFEQRGFDIAAAQEVQIRGRTLKNFRMEKRLPDVR